jgi:hypothetical protein
MNKKLALVAGLFIAMCPGLFAQRIVAMHANIPFNFRMGEQLVSPGTYLIETSGSAITLREENGKFVAASLMSNPESRRTPIAQVDKGELVFNRYGDTYFLASVWGPDSTTGLSLPKTRQERQLAKLAGGLVGTAAVRVK